MDPNDLECPQPYRMTLQWHITERCNLRCKHCYQESYEGSDVSLTGAEEVLRQYGQLLDTLERANGVRPRSHISITGGEPMMALDFWGILGTIRRSRRHSFAILTNGTVLDEEDAKKFHDLRPSFVQMSLDGNRRMHDAIRGEGSFDKAMHGARCLRREGVPFMFSFTAHKGNFEGYPAVARIARKAGAMKVWTDRMVPCGSGAATEAILDPEETRRYVKVVSKASEKWNGGEVAVGDRALQFLSGRGEPYRCNAGIGLIALLPNGDLLPCRRMPHVSGNIFKAPMAEIYFEEGMMRRLRDPCLIPDGCAHCPSSSRCRGGSRCLAYAVTGDPLRSDPGCWLAKGSGPATPALGNVDIPDAPSM